MHMSLIFCLFSLQHSRPKISSPKACQNLQRGRKKSSCSSLSKAVSLSEIGRKPWKWETRKETRTLFIMGDLRRAWVEERASIKRVFVQKMIVLHNSVPKNVEGVQNKPKMVSGRKCRNYKLRLRARDSELVKTASRRNCLDGRQIRSSFDCRSTQSSPQCTWLSGRQLLEPQIFCGTSSKATMSHQPQRLHYWILSASNVSPKLMSNGKTSVLRQPLLGSGMSRIALHK